jgi:hypothetical protein
VKSDDRTIYLAMIIAGLLPVVLARGGSIGAGLTVCVLMIGFGVVGLLGELSRAVLPHAREVKRPPPR